LVGNKCDVEDDIVSPTHEGHHQHHHYSNSPAHGQLLVSAAEHHAAARRMRVALVARVSARTGSGIHKMFQGLIATMIQKHNRDLKVRMINKASNLHQLLTHCAGL